MSHEEIELLTCEAIDRCGSVCDEEVNQHSENPREDRSRMSELHPNQARCNITRHMDPLVMNADIRSRTPAICLP